MRSPLVGHGLGEQVAAASGPLIASSPPSVVHWCHVTAEVTFARCSCSAYAEVRSGG
jgi:hypothetical protein